MFAYNCKKYQTSPIKMSEPRQHPANVGRKPEVDARVVLLGESAVGKSSLALRFAKGEFNEFQEPTIGAAYVVNRINLEDVTLRFEIWDTAGQERYHCLAPMYYRGAKAAIIVYDITKQSSFERARFWVSEQQKHGAADIVIALVGNKVDLEDRREVKMEDAQVYADENGLLFIETSAKTGHNVQELFLELAKNLDMKQHILRPTSAVNISENTSRTPREICC